MPVSKLSTGGNDVSYNNPVEVTFNEDGSSNVIKFSDANAADSELQIVDNSGGVVDASLAVFVDDLSANTNIMNYKFYNSNNVEINDNETLNNALKNDGIYIKSDANFNTADSSFNIDFILGYSVGGDFSFNSLTDFSKNVIFKGDGSFKVSITDDNSDDISGVTIDLSINELTNGDNTEIPSGDANALIAQIKSQVSDVKTNDNYTDFYQDLSNGLLKIKIPVPYDRFNGSGYKVDNIVSKFTLTDNTGSSMTSESRELSGDFKLQINDENSTGKNWTDDYVDVSFELYKFDGTDDTLVSNNCKFRIKVNKLDNERVNVNLSYSKTENDNIVNDDGDEIIQNLRTTIKDAVSQYIDSAYYTDYYDELNNEATDIQIKVNSKTFNKHNDINGGSDFELLFLNSDNFKIENIDSFVPLTDVAKVAIKNSSKHAYTNDSQSIPFDLSLNGKTISETCKFEINVSRDQTDDIFPTIQIGDGDGDGNTFTIDESDNIVAGIKLGTKTLKDMILEDVSDNIDSTNYTDYYNDLVINQLKIVVTENNEFDTPYDHKFKLMIGGNNVSLNTPYDLNALSNLNLKCDNKEAYLSGPKTVKYVIRKDGTTISPELSFKVMVNSVNDSPSWNTDTDTVTYSYEYNEGSLIRIDLSNHVSDVDIGHDSNNVTFGISGDTYDAVISNKATFSIDADRYLVLDTSDNVPGNNDFEIFYIELVATDASNGQSSLRTFSIQIDNTWNNLIGANLHDHTIQESDQLSSANGTHLIGTPLIVNLKTLIKDEISSTISDSSYSDFYTDLSNNNLQIKFLANTLVSDASGDSLHLRFVNNSNVMVGTDPTEFVDLNDELNLNVYSENPNAHTNSQTNLKYVLQTKHHPAGVIQCSSNDAGKCTVNVQVQKVLDDAVAAIGKTVVLSEGTDTFSVQLSELFNSTVFDTNKDFALESVQVYIVDISHNSTYTSFKIDDTDIVKGNNYDSDKTLVFKVTNDDTKYYNNDKESSNARGGGVGVLHRANCDFVEVKFVKNGNDYATSNPVRVKFQVDRDEVDDGMTFTEAAIGYEKSILRGELRYPIGIDLKNFVETNTSSLISNVKYTDFADPPNRVQHLIYDVSTSNNKGQQLVLNNGTSSESSHTNLTWNEFIALTLDASNSMLISSNKFIETVSVKVKENNIEYGVFQYNLNMFKSSIASNLELTLDEPRGEDNDIDITTYLKNFIVDIFGKNSYKLTFHNTRDISDDTLNEPTVFFGDPSSELHINGTNLDSQDAIDVDENGIGLDSIVYKPWKNYYTGYSTLEKDYIVAEYDNSVNKINICVSIDLRQTFTDYNVNATPSVSVNENSNANDDTLVLLDISGTYKYSNDTHSLDYADYQKSKIKFVVDDICFNSSGSTEDFSYDLIQFEIRNGANITKLDRSDSHNIVTGGQVYFNGKNHYFGEAFIKYHFEPDESVHDVTKDASWNSFNDDRQVQYDVNVLPNRSDAPLSGLIEMTGIPQDSGLVVLNDLIVQKYNEFNSDTHEDPKYSDYIDDEVEFLWLSSDLHSENKKDYGGTSYSNAFSIMTNTDYATADLSFNNHKSIMVNKWNDYNTELEAWRDADISFALVTDRKWEMEQTGTNTELSAADAAYTTANTNKENADTSLNNARDALQTAFDNFRDFINSLNTDAGKLSKATLTSLKDNTYKIFYVPQPYFENSKRTDTNLDTIQYKFVSTVAHYIDISSGKSNLTLSVDNNETDVIHLEDPGCKFIYATQAPDTAIFNLNNLIKGGNNINDVFYSDYLPTDVDTIVKVMNADAGWNYSTDQTFNIINDSQISYTTQGVTDSNEGLKKMRLKLYKDDNTNKSAEVELRVMVHDDFLESPQVFNDIHHTCQEDNDLTIDISDVIVFTNLNCDFSSNDFSLNVDVSFGDNSNNFILKRSDGFDIATLNNTNTTYTVALEDVASMLYEPTTHYYSQYNDTHPTQDNKEKIVFTLTNKRTGDKFGYDSNKDGNADGTIPVLTHYINVERNSTDILRNRNFSENFVTTLDVDNNRELDIYNNSFLAMNNDDIHSVNYTDFDASSQVWIVVKKVHYGEFKLNDNKGTQVNKSKFVWKNGDLVNVGDRKKLSDDYITFDTMKYDEYFSNGEHDYVEYEFSHHMSNDTSNNSSKNKYTIQTSISNGNQNTKIPVGFETVKLYEDGSFNLGNKINKFCAGSGVNTFQIYNMRVGDASNIFVNSTDDVLENGTELNSGDDVIYKPTKNYYKEYNSSWTYGNGFDHLTVRIVVGGTSLYRRFALNVERMFDDRPVMNLSGSVDLSANEDSADRGVGGQITYDMSNSFIYKSDIDDAQYSDFSLGDVDILITDVSLNDGAHTTVNVTKDVSYSSVHTLVYDFSNNFYNKDVTPQGENRKDVRDSVTFKYVSNDHPDMSSATRTVYFTVNRMYDDRPQAHTGVVDLSANEDSADRGVGGQITYDMSNSFIYTSDIDDTQYSDFSLGDVDILITDVSLNDGAHTTVNVTKDVSYSSVHTLVYDFSNNFYNKDNYSVSGDSAPRLDRPDSVRFKFVSKDHPDLSSNERTVELRVHRVYEDRPQVSSTLGNIVLVEDMCGQHLGGKHEYRLSDFYNYVSDMNDDLYSDFSLGDVEVVFTEITKDPSDVHFKIEENNITIGTPYPSSSLLDLTYDANYYNHDLCGNNMARQFFDTVKFRFVPMAVFAAGTDVSSDEITINYKIKRKFDDETKAKLVNIVRYLDEDASLNQSPFKTVYIHDGTDNSFSNVSSTSTYSDFNQDELDILITGVSLSSGNFSNGKAYANTLSWNENGVTNVDISSGSIGTRLVTNSALPIDNKYFKYEPAANFNSRYAHTGQVIVDYVKYKFVPKASFDSADVAVADVSSAEVTMYFVVNPVNDKPVIVNSTDVTMNSNQYVEFNLKDIFDTNIDSHQDWPHDVSSVYVEFTKLTSGKLVNLTRYSSVAGSDITDIRGTILDVDSGVLSGEQNYKLTDNYRFYPEIEKGTTSVLSMKVYDVAHDVSNVTLYGTLIDVQVQVPGSDATDTGGTHDASGNHITYRKTDSVVTKSFNITAKSSV